VEDSDMRKLIDTHDSIWQEERDEDELYIALSVPNITSDKKINIIDVVPFAGTMIEKVEWKTASGSFEEEEFNSKLPVQVVGDLSFSGEVRIRMKGIPRNGKYYYSLRYIDIYRCTFRDEGIATYSIGEFDTISEINVNDYASDEIKLKKPLRIQITSDEDVDPIIYYDSNEDPFPLQTPIDIDETPVPLRMKITLTKVDGVTPVVNYIDVM